MNLPKRTQSITNFKRNIKAHLKLLRKTGQPVILSFKGKPALIVQNAAAFYQMLDDIDVDTKKAGAKERIRTINKIRADYKISSPGI